MKKLLIATNNQAKLKTYRTLLGHLPLQLLSLKQARITKDVREDKHTFKENAIKKAIFFGKISGLHTLADDSGLEVDYLNGEPGVHSRRWGGRLRTDDELIRMLLRKMKGVPWNKRRAGFTAVTALYFPENGRVLTWRASQRGIITEKSSLIINPGFPYNQVFYLPKYKKTLSETPSFYSSDVSHRNRNIIRLIPHIKKYILDV